MKKRAIMRICCISDLHGHLPDVPDCDLLLLGGDYPRNHNDLNWYKTTFSYWLSNNAKRMKIIGVAGNHDFVFQDKSNKFINMDWTYLEDNGIEWNGLNIYGTPWQPRFYDWAFNADEPDLKKIWSKIPENTDILILHGPPRGFGDFSTYGNVHTGSPSLTERIFEIRPKLVVAGHIHSGHGRYQVNETLIVNASYVNERYQPHYPIEIVDL